MGPLGLEFLNSLVSQTISQDPRLASRSLPPGRLTSSNRLEDMHLAKANRCSIQLSYGPI